ncbi:MAG: PQQ-dependent sugar dehydrogenase, partial [Anaerolineae bacterium]|nr:PQQ-dependent sugar dehydrogenase [Anaerolineae bacterium]
DLKAMPGRIHRFAVDNDLLVPAPGNPFTSNSTYAYGLRNSFDFDFDPFSNGSIFATENGPACDDEINLIFPGGNYGWRPDYPCDDNNPQDGDKYVYPLLHFTPPEAPTGIIIYDGKMFPEWQGDLFFCGWNKGVMRRAELDDSRTRIERVEILDLRQSCSTDVEVAPDGSIYFTSSGGIHRITTGR